MSFLITKYNLKATILMRIKNSISRLHSIKLTHQSTMIPMTTAQVQASLFRVQKVKASALKAVIVRSLIHTSPSETASEVIKLFTSKPKMFLRQYPKEPPRYQLLILQSSSTIRAVNSLILKFTQYMALSKAQPCKASKSNL
jgi:hypothetical protein